MKNIITKISFLILGLILIVSCTETKNPVYFDLKNNSAKSIYHGVSYLYPDTSLKNIKKEETFIISSGKVYPFVITGFTRNPTMQIFIFDADVIESTPWDTIVKYNKFLKRYQFTKAELEKMNWDIIYDGK
jgi:hypothetical protein